MAHRALISLGLIALVLGYGGCGEDLPDDRTWGSGHFRYHSRSSDDVVCPDLVAVLDQHFSVINDALGQGLPATTQVEYFKFTSQSDLDSNGPCEGGVACSDRTRVMTAAPFHQHELIHAYLFPIGFPPWFFVEGAAVALSCQLPLHGRPTADSWRTAMTGNRNETSFYAAGGWLVAHLLESYEPAKFLQLYAELPHVADADLVSATFERIYGNSLDGVWTDAVARDATPPNCPWDCGQPLLNGSSLGHPPPACGLDDLSRTFEVSPSGGAFVLTSTAPRPVEIGSCGPDNDGPGRSAIPPWTDGMTVVGLLKPGSYFISFNPPAGDLTLGFPMPPALGPDCGTVDSVDVTAFSVMHVTIPRGAGEVNAALSFPAGAAELSNNAQVDGTQVQFCASCADGCTPVPRNTIVPATTSGVSIVRVAPAATDRPFVTTTIRFRTSP